jgi:YVTN family beta-propeller protein
MKSLLLLLVAGAITEPARAATTEWLIVLNKSDHEAALVDPASHEVKSKIPTGRGPHEVAVSPDNKRAYVCNYGAFGLFKQGEQPKLEPGNSITVIDLGSGAVVDTFDLGEYQRPHGIAVSKDGSKLWVTSEASQAVLEVSVKDGAILGTWKTNQDISHMLVPTPDEKKLFIANIRSGSATIIERASGRVVSLPTGDGAEGIDVTPDGKHVWVTNRAANTVSIIETATDSVVASLPSGGDFPIRVKFTPDGKEAWVSCAQSNRVTVFDTKSRKQIAQVEVGAVPVGVQMNPAGNRVYVANTNDNKITVIDRKSRKVTSTFTTGNEPDGMAWVKGR